MAAQSPPFVLQNGSHSAALFREAISSLLATAGGAVGLGDLLVTQNGTPNMSVNIAAGEIWIPGTAATGNDDAPQGQYFGYNDATLNLAVAASNPTNPRIDKVCATVEDAAYSGSNNDWKLQVVTGTPTAGATLANLNGAAATPSNSIVLAYVLVPANATTIITADIQDNRPFAAPNLPLRACPAGRLSETTQTVAASATFTQITGITTDFLRGGVTVSSNGLVVPIAGVYRVSGAVGWGGSVATSYITAVYRNGSIVRRWDAALPAGGSGIPGPNGSDLMLLAANDTLTLYGYQASGANLGTIVSGADTYLSAELVSI